MKIDQNGDKLLLCNKSRHLSIKYMESGKRSLYDFLLLFKLLYKFNKRLSINVLIFHPHSFHKISYFIICHIYKEFLNSGRDVLELYHACLCMLLKNLIQPYDFFIKQPIHHY